MGQVFLFKSKKIITMPIEKPFLDNSVTLVYTGEELTPTINNYNSKFIKTEGTLSAINAGNYTILCTPRPGYTWADGTRDTININWTIEKALPEIKIIDSIILNNENGSQGVAVPIQYIGENEIFAYGSMYTEAQVIEKNMALVVYCNIYSYDWIFGEYTDSIVLTVAEGMNYKGIDVEIPIILNYSITAETSGTNDFTYVPSTQPLIDLTYRPDNSLNDLCKAISNNTSINNTTNVIYCSMGPWQHFMLFNGDDINLTTILDGSRDFTIIGFNHDDLSDPTAYGEVTSTGKAAITFQTKHVLSNCTLNESNTNSGGWSNSFIRNQYFSKDTYFLPNEFSYAGSIKQVNKKTSKGSRSSTITTTSDYGFYLSEIEVFGNITNSFSGEGLQYYYYKRGMSPEKYDTNGNYCPYWLRSPYKNSTTAFVTVAKNYSGVINSATSNAGALCGEVYAFCI